MTLIDRLLTLPTSANFAKNGGCRTAQNILYANGGKNDTRVGIRWPADPDDAPRLSELLAAITEKDVKERLISVFPQSNNLIVVAESRYQCPSGSLRYYRH